MPLDIAEARRLADEVRANVMRLDACGNHEFVAAGTNVLTTQYVCTRCAGAITGMAYRWYVRGREHGAKHGAGA
jgi:hypothetical protein